MPLPASRSKPSIAQPPPRDAAGEDDRARAQDVAAVEVHVTRRGVDPRDRPRDEDLGAEPPRLLQRAARQLVAGHARREAEVVLDPRRRAGLAAGRLALDHDRPQPLRRAVHRRREPGRPGADDHRVVLRGRRLGVRRRAARRPGGAAAARRSCRRRRESRGSRPRPAARPPHCSASSGTSGWSHLNVIWLRSRKRRSSAQVGVPAVTEHDRPRRTAGRPRGPAGLRAADPVARQARRPPRRPSGATAATAW